MKVKNLLTGTVAAIVAVMLYVVILMIGQAIPREWVLDNVITSYEEMMKQGAYFSVADGAGWDGWSDALILNAAVTEYDGSLLEKALANACTTGEGNGEVEKLFHAIYPDENSIISTTYSRYWVGNLTVFKILLIFMPISVIRSLLLMTVMGLLAVTVINIYKLFGGVKGVFPFLASVLLGMYIPNSMCLAFAPDIIIMLIAMNICCVMLRRNSGIQSFCLLFFIVGSTYAYVNYWSFPLITLSFPLIFCTVVKTKEGCAKLQLLKENLLISVCWAAGLGGTVLIKQLLCRIVLGEQSGTDELLFRMGGELGLGERLASAGKLIATEFSYKSVIIVMFLLLIALSVAIRAHMVKRKYPVINFLILALYPAVWTLLLAGHNTSGFVCYIYGISCYALLSAVLLNCENVFKEKFSSGKFLPNIRKIALNILMLCIWVVLSDLLLRSSIYYGTLKSEPWSLSGTDYICMDEGVRVTQELVVDPYITGNFDALYLNKLSVILVNIIAGEEKGVLYVKITDGDEVLTETQILISEITVGGWSEICVDCEIYPEREYEVTYWVEGADLSPYLLVQEESQAVSVNEAAYINGEETANIVVNQYEYKQIATTQFKAYLAMLALVVISLIFNALENIAYKKFGRNGEDNGQNGKVD